MKKNQIVNNPKLCKDLFFLLQAEKTVMYEGNITKYLVKQGINQRLCEITHNFKINLSYKLYDVEGYVKSQSKNIKTKLNKSQDNNTNCKQITLENDNRIPYLIKIILPQMKEQQISWFKVIDKSLEQNQQKDEILYYQVIIHDIQYLNDNAFSTKQLIFNVNRQKGKRHFKNAQYIQAIRIYLYNVNITENLPKKMYTSQQLLQLQDMNLKSKENFMRCFKFYPNKKHLQNSNKFSQELLVKRNDSLSYYLRAIYYLCIKSLTDAMQYANKAFQMQNKKSQSIHNLMKEIRETKLKKEHKN